MGINCDFSGYATRNDLLCGDGRVIKKDAFKHNDGKTVSLIWNHDHNNPDAVLGHAILENRDDGVYAYGIFNDTEQGKTAKALVQHGDVSSLSIWANKLKQNGNEVVHGEIRELSLVLAGANPGAYIDFVMAHGEDSDEASELFASYDERIIIHSDDKSDNTEKEDTPKMANEAKNTNNEKTVKEVFDTLTDEQKEVVYAMIGMALEEQNGDDEEEDEPAMKHNVFDTDNYDDSTYISHSDEMDIIAMAKTPGVGSLQQAITAFADSRNLSHAAFDDTTLDTLLPEYQLLDPKEPKILYDDDTWVSSVINGVHKSPVARVRTRRADARKAELSAKGYTKASKKTDMKKIQLLGRTHDAQTIYIKDTLNRDDILDITDFDVVAYQWKLMRHTLDQTLATAMLVGDGRDDVDPDKIKEDHIRPIWKDDELYCIHQDVDIAAQKAKLQGTNTGANFGDNYIYAEAIIEAALYSREKYKGSGNLTFYCTPHLLNVMLLARDLNGRRIYSSKSDLVAALNVKNIITVEQFEGLTRTTDDSKTKKLLGLFVNMADYQLGCVKGGEITRFDQFDIDFNQQKLLLETRCSGALVEWYSAIALEEDVTA